jgi:predicted phage baseplate assembly protein
MLKRRPLTYVASDTAEGVVDVLNVYVNGVQWHEVASVYAQSGESRVYTVERDVMGNASVTFGDGEHGAAVPSGSENVTATYRVGLGRAGNVPANSLTLLPRSPAGVQSVTNPIAATAGVPRESVHRMRQHVPATVRGLARIISLSDYEDFARQFIGIGKAKAYHLRDGQVELVHITIAGVGGAPVGPDSDLYQRLLREIDACRAQPFPPVDVGTCTRRYFKLGAEVSIIPEHYHRRQAILDQLCEILLREYSFAHRQFGQSVARSEVISTIQRVPGVLAVKMTAFQFTDSANTEEKDEPVSWNLPANPAQLDGEIVHPAEFILLASCDLKLEVPG